MPDEDQRVEGLGPAAIVVILVLGASLSLVLWTNLSRHQELEVERQAQFYASSIADVIEAEIDRMDTSLRRRAQRWTADGYDSANWHAETDLLLADNPALIAVLRADPSWDIAGSSEGKQILREVLPEARRVQTDADAEFIVGPLIAGSGQQVFGIQVRASTDDVNAPTAFAVFDSRRVIESLIDKRAPGFGVSVTANGQELFRRASSGDGRSRPNFRKAESILLPNGKPWTLEVWPLSNSTPMFAPEQGPAIALAMGLLGSALMAAAVHFGTLSWRRERMLRRVNTALEQQVVDTRRGQGELRDLSEMLEARVAERTGELNETIVELETFNYSVSHDLRGPLGAVINFAAILAEDYADRLDATGKDYLRRIVGSASSAVSMMDALLAYSRSGRTELRKTHLDVGALVREVCDEVASASQRNDCAIKIGDLPDAHADENMIRFVFANLIGNACKFARPDEPAHVEVSGSVASNEVIYSVRDEGIGFDMRFADKLFKVFERLHPPEDYAGHGVGLAIVARMVRRHGGRVWAQGAVNKGATFYFTVGATDGEVINGRSAN